VSEFSRRTLLGGAAVAAASAIWSEPLRAQYVWQKPDWHSEEFNKLISSPRRIKQVIHADSIDDGRFLRNSKNSLNGLHFGHGLPTDQIQVVVALNGPANVLNYSDYIWQKIPGGRVGQGQGPQDQSARSAQHFLSEQGGSIASLLV
jgi:hypothetical protein